MYRKKYGVYQVHYCLQSEASTGGLGMNPWKWVGEGGIPVAAIVRGEKGKSGELAALN